MNYRRLALLLALTTTSLAQTIATPATNFNRVALLRWYTANKTVSTTIGAPISAIAFDGQNLWAAESTKARVTKLRAADNAILGSYTTVAHPSAIAFDGSKIWVAGNGGGLTVLQASDGSAVTTLSVGSANTSPPGIAFDGSDIWVTNNSSSTAGYVSRFHSGDASFVGSYPVGKAPMGVIFDGTYIWVANSSSDSLSRLSAQDGSNQGTFALGASPYQMVFDGIHIWVACSGQLFCVRASDGAAFYPAYFGYIASPGGIAFDGVNIWVTDSFLQTVTAVRANDGTMVGSYGTAADFPTAVAFDGANIWVGVISGNLSSGGLVRF